MQSRVLAILIAVVLALVATAALVVYVNGADRRAIADQEPVVVLVAKETIKAGTSGEDAQNRQAGSTRRRCPSESAVSGAFRSVSQLEGKFAAVDIVKGEQLLPTRWVEAEEIEGRGLLPIPDDHQALSIGLDVTRQVAGFVTPGDNVGMVLTPADRRRHQRDPVPAPERPGARRRGDRPHHQDRAGRRRPGQPGEGSPESDRDHPGDQGAVRGARRARGRGRRDLPDADATERGSGGAESDRASPTATSSLRPWSSDGRPHRRTA